MRYLFSRRADREMQASVTHAEGLALLTKYPDGILTPDLTPAVKRTRKAKPKPTAAAAPFAAAPIGPTIPQTMYLLACGVSR